MKKSEVNVGAVLYWARGTEWENPKYADRPAEPVTVIGVPESGSKVLVKHPDQSARLVPVAQLRGPYEETAALVAAAIKARDEAKDTKRAAEKVEAERYQNLNTRAAALGYQVGWSRHDHRATVTFDALDALLRFAERDRGGAA